MESNNSRIPAQEICTPMRLLQDTEMSQNNRKAWNQIIVDLTVLC